ncbi:MAG: lysophospholipid acyltransferase family protein [Pseudomonadota bacterium]
MNYLRSLAFNLFLVVLTIPYALFSFLTLPFKREIRYTLITSWTKWVVWAAKVICGIQYRIEGWENIPHSGVIFLAKHQSRWETLALPALIPLLCFVYKRELHYIPFFGWGIALCGMIPINRGSARAALAQVVKDGGARLREGWNVVMFPEGTRALPGEKLRYQMGGAYLAVNTNTPIVPVAHNAGDCWPKGSFVKRPGLITLIFGPPIAPENMTPDELNKKVVAWIESEMEQRFPHQYGKKTS